MRKRIFVCSLILLFILSVIPVLAEDYSGSALFGRMTLKIPDSGYTVYEYTPYLRTHNGEFVKSDEIMLNVSALPDGVSFNPSENSITVLTAQKAEICSQSQPPRPNIPQ